MQTSPFSLLRKEKGPLRKEVTKHVTATFFVQKGEGWIKLTCVKELLSNSVPSKTAVLSPSVATTRAVAGDCVGERSLVLGEIGGECEDNDIESRDESDTCDELLALGCVALPEVGV